MNIDNNTNISSLVSKSLSGLNLNTLNRSYKAGEKEEKNDNINTDELEKESVQEDNTVTSVIKGNVDVEEIQKYASIMGEELSIEDINYGLKYGRSVIADYNA